MVQVFNNYIYLTFAGAYGLSRFKATVEYFFTRHPNQHII